MSEKVHLGLMVNGSRYSKDFLIFSKIFSIYNDDEPEGGGWYRRPSQIPLKGGRVGSGKMPV